MANNTLIIKLGGALLESDEALGALFDGLTQFLEQQHRPLVLVHGGGCLVDDLLKGLGLKSTKKNGLRVTPFEQIPLIAGALAGTANKQMMANSTWDRIQSSGSRSVLETTNLSTCSKKALNGLSSCFGQTSAKSW